MIFPWKEPFIIQIGDFLASHVWLREGKHGLMFHCQHYPMSQTTNFFAPHAEAHTLPGISSEMEAVLGNSLPNHVLKEIPQETHGFLPTNMELSVVNSPWNQSSENLDQLINIVFFHFLGKNLTGFLGENGFGSYFWDSQNGGTRHQKKLRLGALKFLPISHGERNNPPH